MDNVTYGAACTVTCSLESQHENKEQHDVQRPCSPYKY